MPCPDDFDAWFRLLELPGLGRGAARRLLTTFGSPEAALQARHQAWREVLDDAEAPDPGATGPRFDKRLAQARTWLNHPAHHALSLGDAHYPPQLLEAADPPLLLYLQGPPAVLCEDSVAIVGSRQATPQGLQHARRLAQELVQAGWRVGSGLAAGVDAAAHEGALCAQAPWPAGGATFAVVGSGLDTVYPRQHAELAQRILDTGGALLSEYPPGTPARPHHFPQRNRILAGLCAGTLVVEAAMRSGSLITARLAAENGREVMALPGPIDAPQSRGCHALIQQGAQLVTCLDDLLDTLPPLRGTTRVPRDSDRSPLARRPAGPRRAAAPGPQQAQHSTTEDTQTPLPWDGPLTARPRRATTRVDAAPATSPPPSPPPSPAPHNSAEQQVLQALGHGACTLDHLQSRLGWPTPALLACLLNLELGQHIARLPGGLYQRQALA